MPHQMSWVPSAASSVNARTEYIATAQDDTDSRMYPLYSPLVGMGKGKTRFFVVFKNNTQNGCHELPAH